MCEAPNILHFVSSVEDHDIYLYCEFDDVLESVTNATREPTGLITEAGGNWKQLGGQYSARLDGPHDPNTGQRHVHVYKRNNQLFSLNFDGSSHDNSSGVRIPNKVYNRLSQEYPNLNLPPNQIIESVDAANTNSTLVRFADFLKVGDADRISLGAAMRYAREFVERCAETGRNA